jgi:predicted aspartyl protease
MTSLCRMPMTTWLVSVAVAVLSCSGQQASAGQTVARTRPIPVERGSNVFFARATINGAGPFWFTVDTGATLAVIDPATAGGGRGGGGGQL